MHLICEKVADISFVTEENDSGGKDFFIHGIFMQSAVKNKNGRIYPPEVMETAVNSYINEKVISNRAFGELGHPAGPTINLDRVSHMITELVKDGNNYVGKAKVSSTPMGSIVKNLIQDGASLGVSSRGMGTLKMVKGIQEVQNDFKIATAADVVADPSAPSAFVNGIMEGVEYWYDLTTETWKTAELVHEQVAAINKMSLQEINNKKAKMFSDFIKSLV
ncbi:MAG: hypothetical protein L3J58_12460 [Emcibacter sp.]|nr:hypothetical protein [Emcibacter sp.]